MKTEWWCVPQSESFKLCSCQDGYLSEWLVHENCTTEQLKALVAVMLKFPLSFAIVSDLASDKVEIRLPDPLMPFATCPVDETGALEWQIFYEQGLSKS